MRLPSGEAHRLTTIALRHGSFVDRLGGGDSRRLEALRALAALGEPAVIAELVPLLARDTPVAVEAGRTIVALWESVGPAELAAIDEQARSWRRGGEAAIAWRNLDPKDVPRLARLHAGEPCVVGLIGCHPSGYVRQAAITELRAVTDGREIAFLALRANDWVGPVAERATELLRRRLVDDNRPRVVSAFPYLVRMMTQQRRDHRGLVTALRAVLTSDGGEALLARVAGFDTHTRRRVFAMLGPGHGRVVEAALADTDPIVRLRVIDWLSDDAAVERLATRDPAPVVRARALGVLAERAPGRAVPLIPDGLLDAGATVRGLARFLITHLGVSVVARDRYVAALDSPLPRRLAAAIDGLGEIRATADADRVLAFVDHPVPRVRRAALTVLARLAGARSVAAATAGVIDVAPSVRRAARRLLVTHRSRVDFTAVRDRGHASGEPARRREILSVLAYAPKWDALALLVEALDDADPDVRARAGRLVAAWTDTFNRSQLQPSHQQLDRVRALVERHLSGLPPRTQRLLRFTLDSIAAAPR